MFLRIYLVLILILISTLVLLYFGFVNDFFEPKIPYLLPKKDLRIITSIDTMKYSRDIAREKLKDSTFDEVIDKQIRDIAATGATHVAIGTPYDEEFLPFLKRWVNTARKYKLNVWFRGNWSGWERWFGYPPIDRETHIKKTVEFIKENFEIFEDGDIFVTCNECENGGPGDPRITQDVNGHREFLIKEYTQAKKAFNEIDKKVISNFNSMNGDVARLIMDRETSRKLGGIVVIDHYVSKPEILSNDIKSIAEKSEAKIVLGELGVPIPDINGTMTEKEQADWINEALARVFKIPEVIGVNYWVNVGGSTSIYNEKGEPKEAVAVLTNYYQKNKQKTSRNFDL